MSTTPPTPTADLEIHITRVFNAPLELVWKAWTEAAHIEKWFGPEGFSTRVETLDFRPGGSWVYVMIGPDGTEYPGKGMFKEIVPMERIVATDEFGDGMEEMVPADTLPQGMIVTETFEDLGGQTRVSITILHSSVEDLKKHEDMGVIAGWNSTLDCLEKHLATL